MRIVLLFFFILYQMTVVFVGI